MRNTREGKQGPEYIDLYEFDEQLICFGRRIFNLLESKTVKGNQYALATLDDFLGAVHALIMASHNNPPFKDRTDQPIEIKPLLDRANGIAHDHRIRLSGAWMAGYHFNSAIFRIAAVYNRSLKVITGQTDIKGGIGNRDDSRSLVSEAKKAYKGWTDDDWHDDNSGEIYNEVNGLKHDAKGIYERRAVTISQSIAAVEELLLLLEAWNLHRDKT